MCRRRHDLVSARRGLTRVVFLICASVAAVGWVRGEAIVVENHSFEEPSLNSGKYQAFEKWQSGNSPGWTWSEGVHGSFIADPSDGQYAGTSGDGKVNGKLPGTGDGHQYTAAGLPGDQNEGSLTYSGASLGKFVDGTRYTLTVAVGQRKDQQKLTYSAVLLADGEPVAAVVSVPSKAGTFVDLTFAHTATAADAGKEIGIRITANGSYTQAHIDNVRLDTAAAGAAVGAE